MFAAEPEPSICVSVPHNTVATPLISGRRLALRDIPFRLGKPLERVITEGQFQRVSSIERARSRARTKADKAAR